VVITGVGAVTPIGHTASAFWTAVQKGSCGIAPIAAYDTGEQAAKLAAEVHLDTTTLVPPQEARRMDRFTVLALIAAKEALSDSGITAENTNLERADVLVGSGIGGLSTTMREHSRGLARGFDRISPFYIPLTIPNMAAGRIAIETGFKGDCSCTVTACASSSHAVGEALRHVRHGYADVVLTGGAEACVVPLAMGGFTSMQALHTGTDPARASIPFDLERSGFVLGEGAALLVLEELTHALERGATIYAEVSGFGATCDAYHITAPDPTGDGGARAMAAALHDAGLSPDAIDYINAHGTSTPLNDAGETRAIKTVFGRDTTVPVSSTKSMTGHLLGAAGATEALICALAVRDGFIPATINYRVPDPVCDLDVVPNEGRRVALRHALTSSLGFGGHNATLILSRYDGC
jgi:3-oxoacyl-[acyl-carrier-protein] synthase II